MADEREAIVAWIRRQAELETGTPLGVTLDDRITRIADALARGEHRP